MTETKVVVGKDIKLMCTVKDIDVSDKLNLLISDYIKAHFKHMEIDIDMIKQLSKVPISAEQKEALISTTLLAMTMAEGKATDLKHILVSKINHSL